MDSRKIVCLRKPEVSVERISVCDVTEQDLSQGQDSSPDSTLPIT